MTGVYDKDKIDQLVAELAAEDKRHTAEKSRIFTAMKATVESPKVGDVVEIEQGYSFRGSKLYVEKILLMRWGDFRLRAVGSVIRKDGTRGNRRGEEPIYHEGVDK